MPLFKSLRRQGENYKMGMSIKTCDGNRDSNSYILRIDWEKEIKRLADDFRISSNVIKGIILATRLESDGTENNSVLYERARRKLMAVI